VLSAASIDCSSPMSAWMRVYTGSSLSGAAGTGTPA
jgi:hypothetical protein